MLHDVVETVLNITEESFSGVCYFYYNPLITSSTSTSYLNNVIDSILRDLFLLEQVYYLSQLSFKN